MGISEVFVLSINYVSECFTNYVEYEKIISVAAQMHLLSVCCDGSGVLSRAEIQSKADILRRRQSVQVG